MATINSNIDRLNPLLSRWGMLSYGPHMPITSSATKALRVSKRKRVFNLRRKAEIEKQLKAFRKLVAGKNKVAAEKLVPTIYQALDKAAKTGYIKANSASRTKSRVMAALKKIS